MPLGDTDRAGPAGNHIAFEITDALAKLPVDQRTTLLLGAVEGFTCREISEMLHIPMGTVMSRMSRRAPGNAAAAGFGGEGRRA